MEKAFNFSKSRVAFSRYLSVNCFYDNSIGVLREFDVFFCCRLVTINACLPNQKSHAMLRMYVCSNALNFYGEPHIRGYSARNICGVYFVLLVGIDSARTQHPCDSNVFFSVPFNSSVYLKYETKAHMGCCRSYFSLLTIFNRNPRI